MQSSYRSRSNKSPDVHLVWRESVCMMPQDGRLLAGMISPLVNLFQEQSTEEDGGLHVMHKLHFAEIDALTPQARAVAFARV
ncbi:MAG: hypothetical protein CMQ29_05025 [Gammaproteobacteria bacterium]|nr:hypothetical protein [Gammaproteobacteria bacterium]